MHIAGHNQGTRTGAKGQQPPGAADPDSAHNTQRTTAREQVPGNTLRRHTRQRSQPLPTTEQSPSGWTCACSEGTQPLLAAKKPPSGFTCVDPEGTQPLPASKSRRRGQAATPSRRNTADPARTPMNRSHVARDTAHTTHSTTHRASTLVNRSHMAEDTAHATQHTERMHR